MLKERKHPLKGMFDSFRAVGRGAAGSKRINSSRLCLELRLRNFLKKVS